jgi:hypothetical protein
MALKIQEMNPLTNFQVIYGVLEVKLINLDFVHPGLQLKPRQQILNHSIFST